MENVTTGYGIMGLGLLIATAILHFEFPTPIKAIGIAGALFLVMMLAGMNYLSHDHDFNTGEIRRSIAITFVFLFFGLFMVGDSIDKLNLESTSIINILLDKYWAILSTILAFYFIGRAVEKKDKISKS